MSELSVEEIVARIETCPYHDMEGGDLIDIPYVRMLESAVADCRTLVAFWRERSEALRLIAEGQMVGYEAQTIARAALKDKL